ncbi:MAG TPA: MraY family glycosyltransferase [Candidatus Acidoferrales bacterium]|nr:MraY family glycosyltransferase [Candidatus Acidoferrales bacterium]
MRPEAIAFISMLILTPMVRGLCIHWELYDSVGALKIHSQPIPRLGGVAIALALAAGVSFAGHLSHARVWPFFAALILIWAAGLADDIWHLSPFLRLAAQIGGAILLWYGGWRLPWLKAGPANLTAVCFLTVLFINGFNFLDGSDGLCAGVTAVIAAAYLLLPGITLSVLGSTVAWSLLGVSVGFLVFNFPPHARIFMGDSGSTVLGFGIAFLALDFYGANSTTEPHIALVVPLLMTALPLLDGIMTVLRRLHGGSSVLHGDRRHFYDLLLGINWSPRKVALTIYALTAAMCMIAWLVLKCDFTHALLLCAASIGALTVIAVRLGILRSNDEPSPRFSAAQYRRF